MPNLDLKNKEAVQQWILRRLGAPVVTVELTQDALDDAVEDARRWFAAKKGVTNRMPIMVEPTVQDYRLPDQVEVVMAVYFPASTLDFSLILSPFTFLDEQQIPYQVYAAPTSGGLYGTLVQALQSVQVAKEILGATPDWEQFRSGDSNMLTIYPRPRTATPMIIEYKSNTFTIEQLQERDHDLVKRFALARAKDILGQIRDRYQSFPGAQGTILLNGKDLLKQSVAEMLQLEDEITLSGFPLGFAVG